MDLEKKSYYNCSVSNCLNSSINSEFSFFSLPVALERRTEWLKLIHREDLSDASCKRARVCEAHFSPDSILPNAKRKLLKKNSIPQLLLPPPSPEFYANKAIQTNIQTYDVNFQWEFDFETKAETMSPIIIVHGGAGDIPDSRVEGKLIGTKTAVVAGYEVLRNGGSALDAVEAAVVSMEKDENFNAGYGSVLNLDEEVEMEASIMSGTNLDVGAVTLIQDFPHPISIAHKVLTDSPHSLLGGRGAKRFALEKGFETVPQASLISQNAVDALHNFLKHGEFGKTEIGKTEIGIKKEFEETEIRIKEELGTTEVRIKKEIGETEVRIKEEGVGTVGAVAIDANGNVAVATSTGGMSGKAVGRIGDTPQIGSGTYADDNVGGVSTTGHGESILKYCLAHSIIKLMELGIDANNATKNAVLGMTKRLNNTAGAITLSKNGDVGVYFSSKRMSWAYVKDNKIFYGIEQDQILDQVYPSS